MNVKTTIILIVLVVLVGALWLFIPSRPAGETPETPPPPSATKPLLDPQPDIDKIERITLARPNEPQIVFERAPATNVPGARDWNIVEPLSTPAESSQVNSLARTLLMAQSRTEFKTDDLSDADAGLEPPTATVAFTAADGKKYELQIGKHAVMSTDTYVHVAGRDVTDVANRDLLPLVKKKLGEFRSKRLVDLNPNDATAIQIKTDGKTYDLTRGADQQWVINQPLRAYADREKVLALLRSFSGLRAEEFIDDASPTLARYGLETPYVSIAVTTETKRELPPAESQPTSEPAEPKFETVTKTYGVEIGSPAGLKGEQRYAKPADQSWIVAVSQASVNGLLPKLDELRDSLITRIKVMSAMELTLTVGDTSATFKKDGAQWQGSGDLTQPDPTAINDILQAFADLCAVSYVDTPEALEQYGLAPPRATVSVTASGSVTPVTLLIGSDTASGRNAYVQRAGESTVFVVAAAQATRLAVSPLALHSREILRFPLAMLREVKIECGEGRTMVYNGSYWKLTEPAGAPIAAENAHNLASDLSRLRAMRVVAKGDAAKYGLEPPALTIQVAVTETPPVTTQASVPGPPAAESHTLRVGRVNDVAYAQADDDPYVFELDPTVYRVLTAELIDPKLFDIKPELVNAVTIQSPDTTLALELVDSEWKYTPEPYLALDQAKVKELIDALAQLKVERYLAYHDGDLAAAGLDQPAATVTVRQGDQREFVLKIGAVQAGSAARIAGWVEPRRVFLLPDDECTKLMRGLNDYLKETTPEKQPAPAPPGRPRGTLRTP